MSGFEGSSKKLWGEQGEGVVYGENLSFCVEVPYGGSLHAARVCTFLMLVWVVLGNQMVAA